MAFLKLGDLIDGGHPVTVGDDGTVFTRLNVGQLAGTVDEAPTLTQEICVDDLPIDFLSDSSFASFANDVELTVINFEDYQKDGTPDNTTPNATYNTEDNTSLLDLDDYQLTCASNELLESCLQYNATERDSDDDVGQYLNEDLEDSLDSVATEQLFQSKRVLNYTADDQNEIITPVSELHAKDSRVLFDIGNLSLGTVPKHQGFIKLTTDDCSPVPQDGFDKNPCMSTNLQEPPKDSQRKSVNESDFLISSPVTIKIEPVVNFDYSPSETTTNLQVGAIASQNLTESDFLISSPVNIKIEPFDKFVFNPSEAATNLQEGAVASHSLKKLEIFMNSPEFIKIESEVEVDEINDLDSDIDVTTETETIFEIDHAPEPNATSWTQTPGIKEQEYVGLCSDEAFPSVHCTLLTYPKAPTKEEESNDCKLDPEETLKPSATAAKPSIAKHKCPEPNCDETFPSLPSAKRHCSLVHGPIKPFYCTIDGCGLAFRFASYLSRHVRSKHDDIREHKCGQCGNCFLTNRDLAVHERKHTGERSEPCPDPGCELTFSTRAIANTHFLVKHRMVRSFMCDECGKAFGTLSNLREHGVTHTGAKDFVCTVIDCGKAFQTKGKLKRHGNTHTKVRPYECKQCGCTFRMSSSLKGHVKKKHSESGNDLGMSF